MVERSQGLRDAIKGGLGEQTRQGFVAALGLFLVAIVVLTGTLDVVIVILVGGAGLTAAAADTAGRALALGEILDQLATQSSIVQMWLKERRCLKG